MALKGWFMVKVRPGWKGESPFREAEYARVKCLGNRAAVRTRDEVRLESARFHRRSARAGMAVSALIVYFLAPVLGEILDVDFWWSFAASTAVSAVVLWTATLPDLR